MGRGATTAAGVPSANGERREARSAQALVRRAKRGEPAAFEQIFRRYHQDIFRYCRALLGDASDAEDAMQATMAAALRALPGERREIALRPWLFRIARNESITLIRARMPGLDGADGASLMAGAAADADASERERLRTLVRDLNQLPERQRSALVMRELSDLSYGEIAAALETSEGAAKQVVYEARMALRALKEGREMGCEQVQRTLSESDGRKFRGRKLRAHLRACQGCQAFKIAIAQRQADLGAIAPPLPAAVATGLLASLLGGSAGTGAGSAAAGAGGAAAAAAGGGAAGTAATLAGGAGSGVIKGASIVAATVIAAGGAHATGVVDLPLPGAGDEVAAPAAGERVPSSEPRGPASGGGAAGAPAREAGSGPPAERGRKARRRAEWNRSAGARGKRSQRERGRSIGARAGAGQQAAGPPPHARAGGQGGGSERAAGPSRGAERSSAARERGSPSRSSPGSEAVTRSRRRAAVVQRGGRGSRPAGLRAPALANPLGRDSP